MAQIPDIRTLEKIYQTDEDGARVQQARYQALAEKFTSIFGPAKDLRWFSAPGRTELAGNHTDHNRGRVLAAAVDLDCICACRPNGRDTVRLWSDGFNTVFEVALDDLAPDPAQFGTTGALIRGVCDAMHRRNIPISGFDAVCASQVAVGSGLSSSAAFEVMLATAVDGLFGAGSVPPIVRAQAAQYAENVHFGKPSGLMDQVASACGALVSIDFGPDTPVVMPISTDFSAMGYVLAVTFTGGAHDDLTDCYAAIPAQMRAVAACFGKETLSQVSRAEFDRALPVLRARVGDQAILRAIHFFDENERVLKMQNALVQGDMKRYLDLTVASGESSWMQLQNVVSARNESLALALTLSRDILRGKGAWRVHGGGFAGTILAVVPDTQAQDYRQRMQAVFGPESVRLLQVRAAGAVEVPASEASR